MSSIELVQLIGSGTFYLFVIGSLIRGASRMGKVEGQLTRMNGNYIKCPFYKGHVDKEVKAGQHGKDTKC